MSARPRVAALLALAGLAPLSLVQAAPADTLALARQVNEQIVHKHMRGELQRFVRTLDGSAPLPRDMPAGCQAQVREAVTGMYAAMAEHLKAGIEEPAYQHELEQRLAVVYSSKELQGFLARSGSTDVATLSRDILSGPGLKEIEDAQMDRILEGLDENSTSNPALAAALRAASAANEACTRLQIDAG